MLMYSFGKDICRHVSCVLVRAICVVYRLTNLVFASCLCMSCKSIRSVFVEFQGSTFATANTFLALSGLWAIGDKTNPEAVGVYGVTQFMTIFYDLTCLWAFTPDHLDDQTDKLKFSFAMSVINRKWGRGRGERGGGGGRECVRVCVCVCVCTHTCLCLYMYLPT
jgi:Angiotensin II, type I receptor-associated protein (AGTRAP)